MAFMKTAAASPDDTEKSNTVLKAGGKFAVFKPSTSVFYCIRFQEPQVLLCFIRIVLDSISDAFCDQLQAWFV